MEHKYGTSNGFRGSSVGSNGRRQASSDRSRSASRDCRSDDWPRTANTATPTAAGRSRSRSPSVRSDQPSVVSLSSISSDDGAVAAAFQSDRRRPQRRRRYPPGNGRPVLFDRNRVSTQMRKREMLAGGRPFPRERIVFVANLHPHVNTKFLYWRFLKHGKILSLDHWEQKGYCTILYDTSLSARTAVKNEYMTVLCGQRIDSRISDKSRYFHVMQHFSEPNDSDEDFTALTPATKQQRAIGTRVPPGATNNRGFDRYIDSRPMNPTTATRKPINDCEIIVLEEQSTTYANEVEGRLQKIGLSVSLRFPAADDSIDTILKQISSRGVLFAVIIHPTNEERRSASLNILHGGAEQEHRNIPLDELLQLVNARFEQRFRQNPNLSLPAAVLALLEIAIGNKPLTAVEYDKLIRFLSIKRDHAVREEGSSNLGSSSVLLPGSALVPPGIIGGAAMAGVPYNAPIYPVLPVAPVVDETPSNEQLELQQRILKLMQNIK